MDLDTCKLSSVTIPWDNDGLGFTVTFWVETVAPGTPKSCTEYLVKRRIYIPIPELIT